jgi:hypothetical protein
VNYRQERKLKMAHHEDGDSPDRPVTPIEDGWPREHLLREYKFLKARHDLAFGMLAWFLAHHDMKLADIRRLAGNMAAWIGKDARQEQVLLRLDEVVQTVNAKIFESKRS